MSVKYVTPPEPAHDGGRNLAAHQSTLDGLCTQLESSLKAFQQIYIGKGSDTYHTKEMESLQDLQTLRDHVAQASVLHMTMATNFDTALAVFLLDGVVVINHGYVNGVPTLL